MKIFHSITVMKVNGTIAKGIIAMTCFTRNRLFFVIHFCFCTVANFRNLYHRTTTPFTDYLCNKKRSWLFFIKKTSKLSTADLIYRVSHCKVNKVILLWWGDRFWFLLIFWVLHLHEIGPFMPQSSVFIEMMFWAIYGQESKYPKKI